MADIDINYDPISVNSGPVSVDITGLNDIGIRYPDPIQTDTKVAADLTLRVPELLRTDSKTRLDSASELTTRSDLNANVDLQPVVLDQCLRLALAPLPPTRVCLPSYQSISLSFFGVEIVSVVLEGEARVDISALPKAPFVRLAGATKQRDAGLRVRLGG